MYPYKPVNGTLYDVLTDDYNAQRIAEHFGKCITHGKTPELQQYTPKVSHLKKTDDILKYYV